MSAPADKKRKRTGKQREEAKRAAIEAAAAAEAGAEAAPEAIDEDHADEAATTGAGVEVEAEVAETNGDVDEASAEGEAVPEKRRKRTGKMREEAKRLAIQKRLEAEAEAAARGEEVPKKGDNVDFDALAKRIPPALKKLHPVFKQAKKAETMRLIKKIRFLKTKDHKDEVAELETQLKFLGMIDLHVVATTHLRQKINKHHTLKHVELPAAVTALLPISSSVDASSEASKSPALVGKVENRLCSGKQVADAIKPVVSWVLSEPGATLNVAAKPAPKKAGGARKLMVDESDDDEGSIGDAEDDPEPLGAVTALESDDEAVIEDRAADDAGWESGDFGGEDDGDADGWESGSVGGSGSESDTAPPAKRAKKTKEDKPAKPAPAPKAAAARPPRADGSSSMFLPSLAAGFTAGDSDSDPDMDYDPTGTIGTKAPPRKNRRGQRARQAIWEKKYGKGAKHVVAAREEAMKKERGPNGQRRDMGWGARGNSGPVDGTAAPAGGVAPASAPVLARPSAAPSSFSAPKPAAAQEKAVHPSWEAAKARKAREMAGGKDAPKATKIVFD